MSIRAPALAAMAVIAICPRAHATSDIAGLRTLKVRDLLSLKGIGGAYGALSTSPDGRSVAFQIQETDFDAGTYHSSWYVAPILNPAVPRFVGAGGELTLIHAEFGLTLGARADLKAQWSPDGRWIAYLRQDNGVVQVWRSRVDVSSEEQVTHSDDEILGFAWKPDSDGMYVRLGRNRHAMQEADRQEADRGYLLDDRFFPAASLKPMWVLCEGNRTDAQPSPSQACVPTWRVLNFGAPMHKADAAEQTAIDDLTRPPTIPGVETPRKVTTVVASPIQGNFAWLENEHPEEAPGFLAPLTVHANGRRCARAPCTGELAGLWWAQDEVIFLSKEGHAHSFQALYAWTPRTNALRLLRRVDGTFGACETAQSDLVCLEELPNAPRKIVRIRVRDGSIATVYDPNPQFADFNLGAIERLEWSDKFGNDTFAHLVYPPDHVRGRPYPLVIVQYRSRGFLNGGVGNEYPIFPLAAAGFLVLSFDRPEDFKLLAKYVVGNVREQGVSEARNWKDAYTRWQAQSALDRVLERLIQQGTVDPTRIGITGLSDGTSTTDFALYQSKWFAAAAISSPDWSPAVFDLYVNQPMREDYRAIVEADSTADAIKKWTPLSLAAHVDQVTTPLLAQIADHELLYALPNILALRDAGRPVETYVFSDEYHIKWQPQHKLAIAERAIDWFRYWLLNERDESEEKVEQYGRWDALREKQRSK